MKRSTRRSGHLLVQRSEGALEPRQGLLNLDQILVHRVVAGDHRRRKVRKQHSHHLCRKGLGEGTDLRRDVVLLPGCEEPLAQGGGHVVMEGLRPGSLGPVNGGGWRRARGRTWLRGGRCARRGRRGGAAGRRPGVGLGLVAGLLARQASGGHVVVELALEPVALLPQAPVGRVALHLLLPLRTCRAWRTRPSASATRARPAAERALSRLCRSWSSRRVWRADRNTSAVAKLRRRTTVSRSPKALHRRERSRCRPRPGRRRGRWCRRRGPGRGAAQGAGVETRLGGEAAAPRHEVWGTLGGGRDQAASVAAAAGGGRGFGGREGLGEVAAGAPQGETADPAHLAGAGDGPEQGASRIGVVHQQSAELGARTGQSLCRACRLARSRDRGRGCCLRPPHEHGTPQAAE